MEVSDQLMPELLFTPGKRPTFSLNEADWALESVWMLFGEEKISARV